MLFWASRTFNIKTKIQRGWRQNCDNSLSQQQQLHAGRNYNTFPFVSQCLSLCSMLRKKPASDSCIHPGLKDSLSTWLSSNIRLQEAPGQLRLQGSKQRKQHKINIFECEKHFFKLEQFSRKQYNTIEGRTLKCREKADFVPASNSD